MPFSFRLLVHTHLFTAAVFMSGCGLLDASNSLGESVSDGGSPTLDSAAVVRDALGDFDAVVRPDGSMGSDGDTADLGTPPCEPKEAYFQDGVSPTTSYAGTTDTYVGIKEPVVTHGSESKLCTEPNVDTEEGAMRVLVRWELVGIPDNAQILAVALVLHVQGSSNSTHQIFPVEEDWDEGYATWNDRKAGVPWATPSQLWEPRQPSLEAFDVPEVGSTSIVLGPKGVQLVQDWISGATANYGILIHNTGQNGQNESWDGATFHAREESALPERPQLRLTYCVPN